jgi:dTDP-glucose pyrophosphorylase/predicted transcriptional regulator
MTYSCLMRVKQKMISDLELSSCLLGIDSSISQVVESLNKSGVQIVVILDKNEKFIGTITDGDIRRAILNGSTIDSSISSLVNKSSLTVDDKMTRDQILSIMQEKRIHQIPIVDSSGTVTGLHLWDQISKPNKIHNTVVIMAGGRGLRLKPLTEKTPKPMIRVNNQPMLENIILRAKSQGFNNFVITINYLAEQIKTYFEDGKKFGVNISYIEENQPLGTAGGLKQLENAHQFPFIVSNGDVLTDTSFIGLLSFHNAYNYDVTIAVKTHEWANPFGVVKTEGTRVVSYIEKPINYATINAGIYCLNPKVLSLMEPEEYLDMSDFIQKCIESGLSVGAYALYEKWQDIGQKEDLDKANSIGKNDA